MIHSIWSDFYRLCIRVISNSLLRDCSDYKSSKCSTVSRQWFITMNLGRVWSRKFYFKVFFFVVHFLLPWMVFIVIILHLLFLHKVGRTSILGYSGGLFKVRFWPYYWAKDLINVVPLMLVYLFLLEYPYMLGDTEIFVEANCLARPVHIVPEWYFLCFYAILRTLPNKNWGVFFLIIRLLLPLYLGLLKNYIRPLILCVRGTSYIIFF